MKRWIPGVGQVAFEACEPSECRIANLEFIRILKMLIEREKSQPGSGTV